MADVDAIARLLDLGFNAVFLVLLWRVYQDYVAVVNANRAYLEKLVEKLLPDEETPVVPAYRPPPNSSIWETRTPTSLGDDRRGAFQPNIGG